MIRLTKKEKKSLLIGGLALSVAAVVLSAVVLYMNTLGAAAPPEFITLEESQRISFKAHLTDETPFGRPYLNSTSDNIPLALLDRIELAVDYMATLSSPAQINFLDSATITIVATQNRGVAGADNNPVILNRTFPFCRDNSKMTNPEVCPDGSGSSTPATINGDIFSRGQTYELYLRPYLDFVVKTTESYTAYPINATATVSFQMSANNMGQLRSLMTRSVTVPMTDDNFKLTLSGEEVRSRDFYSPVRSFGQVLVLAIFGGLLVGSLGVAIWIIKKLLNKKSPYRAEVDGYLGDYEDAIIKTVTPPDLDNYAERIAVESFKELLNLAVSISDPVVYFETPKAAIFYIARDDKIYYYVVKNPNYRDAGGGKALDEMEEALLLPEKKAKHKLRIGAKKDSKKAVKK